MQSYKYSSSLVKITCASVKDPFHRAGEMDFKVMGGGGMKHGKVLSATMVGRQEKFSNSRRSRMAKTIIFWPWWQPFNSFCFETLSFLPLSPFFLFATQKSGAAIAPPAPPVSPPCFSTLLMLTIIKVTNLLSLK